VLATLEKKFNVKPLTKRDAASPDFTGVVTLAKARTDDPLAKVKAPKSSTAPPPTQAGPDHLEQVYADSVARLPVADKKGHRPIQDPPKFAHGKDAMKWAHDHYKKWRETKS